MRKQHTVKLAVIILVILSLDLVGCIATRTFPLRAMPGETISLTLGRTMDEAGDEGVTKNDLVITIRDAQNVDHVINSSSSGAQGMIRGLIRGFPDPLSFPTGPTGPSSGQVGAFIDLPTDLAVGPAKVRWQVLNGKLPYYVFSSPPLVWPLSSYANNIDLEVLPGGPGNPHVFEEKSVGYTDLHDLEPSSRIRFNLETTRTDIGALQVQLNLNPSVIPGYLDGDFKITHEYRYEKTSIWQNAVNVPTVPYSNQMRILLAKTTGGGKKNFRFYMVWQYDQTPEYPINLSGIEGATVNQQDPTTGTLDSNHFAAYDLNGNRITDATMTLKVYY